MLEASRVNFNGAHIHLLFNHVPVVLYPFIFLTLLYGMLKNENAAIKIACAFAVAAGIFSIIAYVTGEDAEAILKQLPDYPRDFVHEHEAAGKFGLIGGILVMVVALVPLFLRPQKKWLQIVLLILTLWITTVHMRVAYLGGIVRHTEVRAESK